MTRSLGRDTVRTALLACCVVALSAVSATAQLHGVQIGKSCQSPRCVGETTDCLIQVGHGDGFGDTIGIIEAFDVIEPVGAATRVPPVGSLPIVGIDGNAFCSDSGGVCDQSLGVNCGFPCYVGPANSTLSGLPGDPQAGFLRFRQNTYVIQPADPSPLRDQANVRVMDLCDSPTTQSCSSLSSLVQFTAATTLTRCVDVDCQVEGCTNGVCSSTSICEADPDLCDDDDECTVDTCDDELSDCCAHTPVSCDERACFSEECDSAQGCVYTSVCTTNPSFCDDGDSCTTDTCNDQAAGCCEHVDICVCGDGNLDPGEVCDGSADSACPGECTEFCTCPPPPGGCRITGGRTNRNGRQDPSPFEDILRGQGGGQVGAPCGCIGCFTTPDPDDDLAFEHIQGNWQYSRKDKKGTFHAKMYNSLICGCDSTSPVCDSTGVSGAGFLNPVNFAQGELCNRDNPIPGPGPRPSPANIACFSGIGAWTGTNGRKETLVAFRVEVEDRGEPAVGGNADDTCDVHRIRIWIPAAGENLNLLADGACCTNALPSGQAARAPNVDDGGNLTHGNMQIHPMLPNSQDGTCPVPNGSCQQ